mmetsp:Transcript_28596/g.77451  ORF Transcript_28596/g.77451 Transcript_28596/m.77451 type:complete len:207 (+) Transcript_28596:580-1200(+)
MGRRSRGGGAGGAAQVSAHAPRDRRGWLRCGARRPAHGDRRRAALCGQRARGDRRGESRRRQPGPVAHRKLRGRRAEPLALRVLRDAHAVPRARRVARRALVGAVQAPRAGGGGALWRVVPRAPLGAVHGAARLLHRLRHLQQAHRPLLLRRRAQPPPRDRGGGHHPHRADHCPPAIRDRGADRRPARDALGVLRWLCRGVLLARG